jgi:hypothetical protein
MFGDELVEEFAALCTNYEVRTFEVQGTVVTRLQLNNTWPLEEYLDDILTTQRFIVKELPTDLIRLCCWPFKWCVTFQTRGRRGLFIWLCCFCAFKPVRGSSPQERG